LFLLMIVGGIIGLKFSTGPVRTADGDQAVAGMPNDEVRGTKE
jgi:hypothetical protein